MNLLLDTHIFLWYVSRDSQLSPAMVDAIRNPSNTVFVSVVAVWESVIKHSLGKLPLPELPSLYLPLKRDAHGFTSLPIEEAAMQYLSQLPPLHRDPFDRMLIAQALQYDLTLVTADAQVRAYPVSCFSEN